MAARPISETLRGYGRGIGGGLFFSIAPLYTMEIWWQGYLTPPVRMLFTAVLMFIVLIAYAHYVGVHADRAFKDNVLEALQIITLSTLLAALILKLAGQLPATLTAYEAISRIVIEATATAIGVAIGATQLGQDEEDESEGGGKGRTQERERQEGHLFHELAFAVLGALLITVGIAPTEEITMIAVTASPWAVLGTALAGFILALLMVHFARIKRTRVRGRSLFAGGPLGDACVTYAIALLVAAVMLWVVGSVDRFGTAVGVYQIVYLALPAALGASAGRLIF